MPSLKVVSFFDAHATHLGATECQMLEAAKQAHEKTIAYACHHLRYLVLQRCARLTPLMRSCLGVYPRNGCAVPYVVAQKPSARARWERGLHQGGKSPWG